MELIQVFQKTTIKKKWVNRTLKPHIPMGCCILVRETVPHLCYQYGKASLQSYYQQIYEKGINVELCDEVSKNVFNKNSKFDKNLHENNYLVKC